MDISKTEQEKTTALPSRQWCSPIVELRQYTLHPGQRDVLIDLFERAFIESQEAAGITVIGQFRDLEDPNRFVWLRGFPDMDQRLAALQAFYGGPVWQAHRDAANATIIDSDNVLLLRPARPTSGFLLDPRNRLPAGTEQVPPGLVVATILSFETAPSDDVLDWFEDALAPVLTNSGASILAWFVTETIPNTFPALPVREGEQVLVWFSRFRDAAAYDEHAALLAQSKAQLDQLWQPMMRRLKAAPHVLKLSPTARSLVHV
jgi:quinol monooxygenase YgiN